LQYKLQGTCPVFFEYKKENLSMKFLTLEEAKNCYGAENLIPISLLKQILFYVKQGCQPKFVWESEKEEGHIVAWFHKEETKIIYRRWIGNRPVK